VYLETTENAKEKRKKIGKSATAGNKIAAAAGQDSSRQNNTARTGSSAEMQLWPIESSSQMTATPSGVESGLQTDQTSSKPMKTLEVNTTGTSKNQNCF